MNELMSFGPWEIQKSSYVSVCGNFERAGSIKASDASFDLDAKTAHIVGSSGETYVANMDECSCDSFRFGGGVPCKHMIRLAMELGESFVVPAFDPKIAAGYDVQEDIERLTERWRSGALTLDALNKCIAALKSSEKKAKKRPPRRKNNEP